jgi:hypothetical protein
MRLTTKLLATAATGLAIAGPAYAIPIRDGGVLDVGECFMDTGTFTRVGNNLFGLLFEIQVDVTAGSGFSLTLDSFGSEDLGSDTELALYNEFGDMILAINDDAGDGSLDSYLGFGDADQFATPFNGTTRQGNIVNVTNLLAGKYLVVIGPYDTTWDSFNVDDTEVDNFQGSAGWVCTVCLIPAPGSLALLGLGGLMIGHRRRHR